MIVALVIYLPLYFTGALDKISNAEDLKNIIVSGGVYSYIIFFVIQFLQCSLLPIPAIVSTVAGTLVFGPWISTIISFFAVMLASLFNFWLGRKFGKKIVEWIIGEEETAKWQQKLSKGKYLFFLMMLFPLFPDDILCLVVGAVTNISFKFFFITNLITRPIGILCTTLLASGYLIPFSGWGIPVWIALIVVGLILMILSFKYNEKIENFVTNLSDKLTNKKTKNFNN